MDAQNKLQQPLYAGSLIKRALWGGGIALALMILFLFPIKNPDPDWGKFWYIQPLVVITFAGAAGGVFYHFMGYFRYQGGWKKVAAYVISAIVYLFALWIGTVLGLNGTLWN